MRKLIRRIIFVGAGAAAAAVGSCGLIGFVGLVSPHLARRLVGVDVRWALPASALVGGSLLLLSDLAAQRLVRSTEMPVGAITALLGAASLIFIIKRSTVRFGTM